MRIRPDTASFRRRVGRLGAIVAGAAVLAATSGTALAHTGQGNATPSNGGTDPKASHPGWSQDYCTKSPDNPGGRDFRHACVHHDGCLTGFPRNGQATYWSSRGQCNAWFHDDLKATCRELYSELDAQFGCYYWANVYAMAVIPGAHYKGPSGYKGPAVFPEPTRPLPERHAPVVPLPQPNFPTQQPIAPLPTPQQPGTQTAAVNIDPNTQAYGGVVNVWSRPARNDFCNPTYPTCDPASTPIYQVGHGQLVKALCVVPNGQRIITGTAANPGYDDRRWVALSASGYLPNTWWARTGISPNLRVC